MDYAKQSHPIASENVRPQFQEILDLIRIENDRLSESASRMGVYCNNISPMKMSDEPLRNKEPNGLGGFVALMFEQLAIYRQKNELMEQYANHLQQMVGS